MAGVGTYWDLLYLHKGVVYVPTDMYRVHSTRHMWPSHL